MTLTELAERAEKATGPDERLDYDIADAVGAIDCTYVFAGDWPKYTASIDAAMSLVPEGYDPLIDYTGCDTHGGKKVVELYYGPEEREIVRGCATTGPLALVAAALRAREVK